MALIHIADENEPIEAGRQRILEAALAAGVPFPHGCSSGECGGCKCALLEGDVDLDRYSPDALSAEERARGLILACRARPLSDVRIRCLTEAAMPVVKLRTQVSRIEQVAHDVVVLRLALPERKPFAFRPGQFARLRFGRLPVRSYSMANAPGQDHLDFHIRVLPDGRVSRTVATTLQPGDAVEVQGPFGDAYWRGPSDAPLLLLAGGTGLAPILSVLSAALRDGQSPAAIHVYHGVRTEADLYVGDWLGQHARDHGFRFVPVFSQSAGPGSRQAHMHEAVAEDFGALDEAQLYVCGPPPMVDAVRQLALSRGAAADRIHADPFYAAEPEKQSLWKRITGTIQRA